MPASLSDTQAIARELEALRAEFSQVESDPELAHAFGERLSLLGAQITAACERAFVKLTETSAA